MTGTRGPRARGAYPVSFMRQSAGISSILSAILACGAAPGAGAFAHGAAPQDATVTLARPVDVRARLLSGGTFAGKLECWDATSLHGSFGTRGWNQLVAADLRRIYAQVMTRTNGAQWLTLAELLASSSDGAPLAEDAFKQAKQHGQTDEQVAAARARAKQAAEDRAQREREESEKRLKGDAPRGTGQGAESPTSTASTASPAPFALWPVLTTAQQADAAAATRKNMAHALDVAGIRADPVESRFFVIGGDLPKGDLERLGRDMDAAVLWGMAILGLPTETAPFWGKPTMLAVATEDTYSVAEAALYNAKVAPGQQAALHVEGPMVSMTAWRGNDATGFRTAALQQVARALLYRAHSGAPLPEWAESGFADWVARGTDTRAPIDRDRRAKGLAFLRGGGQAAAVMASSAANGTWPGPGGTGPAAAYLVVDFMIAERPSQLALWVGAIKGGAPWEDALKRVYGVTAAELGASVNLWYRTNDGAPRR